MLKLLVYMQIVMSILFAIGAFFDQEANGLWAFITAVCSFAFLDIVALICVHIITCHGSDRGSFFKFLAEKWKEGGLP